MSKKVLSSVLAVASVVALFVPIPGFQAIGIAGLKISTAMLLSAGLAIGAALLVPKPKVNREASNRLLASFEVDAPRKIVFGTTAGPADVRYTGRGE